MKRFLSAFLLVSLSFASAQQSAKQPPQKREITIEAVYGEMGAMMRAPRGMQWSPDGTRLAYIQGGQNGEQALYYFDPATGKSSVLVASDRLATLKPPTPTKKGDDREKDNRARYGVAAYHWSPDSKNLLFDSMGQLWLYNLQTNAGTQLTTAEENLDPKFSPDGKYISFVRKHNLYLKATGNGPEKQLTADKDENLLNGEADWVYTEELAVRSNYFWSPDSRQIIFMQMNETPVPRYPIVDWMQTHPSVDNINYPKAGDPNPTVKLGVLDLNGKVKWVTPTTEADVLIPRFGWVKPGFAWALVLNRVQNKADLYVIDVNAGKSRKVLSETSDVYIDVQELSAHFLKSGDSFLWPSWRDGHTHLYLYSLNKSNPASADATLVSQLTKGDWEVLGLEGLDEKTGTVFFRCNKDDDRQVQLYSVKLDGTALARITKEPGVHTVAMPDTANYYLNGYSTLTSPTRLALCAVSGPCNDVYQGQNMADTFDLLTPQFVDFKADDGTVLHGVILLPKSGPAMVNGKFPVILNPYGGPGAQTVRDSAGTINMFDQYLAKQGIAVLKVDNRGMSNRGKKFAGAILHHILDTELKDQLTALDQALTQFPQLDGSRVGYWGWSYGGSMTAYALTHSDRFKAGVAVAPVTDPALYDTIYTERYMDLPKNNPEGYKNSSIVNAAANLKGHLLLVHGTSDDNVHMQNTLELVNAFIAANKPYDLQLYPQKTHSISGKAARLHLYTRIVKHFEEYLMK